MAVTATAPEPGPDVPSVTTETLRACLWVGIGSCIRGHLLFLLGLPVLLAGFAIAWRVMWCVGAAHPSSAVDRPILSRRSPWLPKTCLWLAVMAVVGLAAPSTIGPLWYDLAKRAYFVLGLAVVGVFRYGSARQTTRAVGTLTVAAISLHLVTLVAVPTPDIDVFIWTQACLEALLRGVHPYTVDVVDLITNVYDLGPTATLYPYMPLTLVAFAPGYALFGDFRVMLALCVPVTIALNRATGRQLGLDSTFIEATTLAFLLFPRGVWLTCFGWNEPLLVVVVSAFVYLATRAPGGAAQAIAFLLLPALKQYIVAPVLLFLAISRPRVSVAAIAMAVASATGTDVAAAR